MTKPAPWGERAAKIAAMDGAELRTRITQALTKRIDALRFRLGACPEPGIQSHPDCPPPRFFFSPTEVPTLTELVRDRLHATSEQIVDRADRLCAHRFDLLGYRDLSFGDDIDWHLDPVSGRRSPLRPWHKVPYLDYQRVGDAKVTWELNRHQHWVILAKAHLLTGQARYVDEIAEQWRHWWTQNPYPMGTNWASALEVGFRSLSWLWVKHLLAPSDGLPPAMRDGLTKGLALSGRHIERYLSTYFSPNTHLLGEAVALFFIGVLQPEIAASERWRRGGWEVVVEQARRQVRADGLHFERSAYYHVYALDLFLHARALAARNGVPVPQQLDRVVSLQLDALAALAGAGRAFEFGDDDGGRLFDGNRNRSEHLLDPLATGAALFARADWKALAGDLREETIWLLGEAGVARFDALPERPPEASSRAFEDSGLFVLVDRHATPRQALIGPGSRGAPGGGHGHADLLSVQLVIGDSAVLSDSGTFAYVGDGGIRERFRGTAAHNTVVIDGHSQATPLGPFSWGAFPDPVTELWVTGAAFDLFKGHHDGYRAPTPGARHTRWVLDLKRQFLLVRDVVDGSNTARLDIRWNLGDGVDLDAGPGDGHLARVQGHPTLLFLTAAGHGWETHVEPGWRSPAYGHREPRTVLRFSSDATLPAEFVTLLYPQPPGPEMLGSLHRIDDGRADGEAGRSATGYEYRTGREAQVFCFGDVRGAWQVADWCSDADFLYCRVDDSRRISEAVVVGGTHVRCGEQLVEAPSSAADHWIWKG